MANTIKRKTAQKKPKLAIVAAQFNEYITTRLLDGCLDELSKKGIRKRDVSVYWVPGSFEIPVVALKLAKKRNVDAVICLGAVIRGGTYHFELVADSAAQGIIQASLLTQKPIIFGILSTNTVEQAHKRSSKKDNKGRDAALTALSMCKLLENL